MIRLGRKRNELILWGEAPEIYLRVLKCLDQAKDYPLQSNLLKNMLWNSLNEMSHILHISFMA